MTLNRRDWLACAATGLLAPMSLGAQAAAWPERMVKLIVPNVPGGGIDILGRLMQGELAKLWGAQNLMIEYKPGAGTMIGTDFVAKAPPDGYTIGMVVTSHVINPHLRASMPYDTLKDLAAVGMTATSGVLLTVAPSLPVSSLKELIDYGKKNKLSYATPGAGSSMHLAGELLRLQTGIDMNHIAYKGSGGAYADVFSGRVDILIDPVFSSIPHVNNGKLKAIAVMSAKRDPSAPNIPAAGETLPDFDVKSINGLVVPAATPKELVQRISADVAKVLKSEELKPRLAAVGLTPVGSTPEQFDQYIRAEYKRWGEVVRKADIKLE